MDIEDFLVRFYGLWRDEAEVLARALGFETAADDVAEGNTYEDYINAQVAAIEVIKQLEQSENIEKSLSELEPDDYISLLKSQELLEKAFKKIEKDSKAVAKAAAKEDGEATAKVESTKEVATKDVKASPSDKVIKNKETPMTKEVKVVETDVTVEMVEKSALDSIQKALQAQTEELQKALATVKQFEIEKAAAIQKSRKDLLKATVKDDEKVEAFVKGLANVESEEIFQEVVKALEGLMITQTKSDLFVEKGFSSEDTTKLDEETPLMKAVKAAAQKAKSTK
jgi:chemotaxis protein histidine kinase CheA